MALFPHPASPWAQEVHREEDQLQTYSVIALKNRLAYCQARVVQLNDQYDFLTDLSRQEGDLYVLCRLWQRMERTGLNYHRFREKCVIIELELSRRRPVEKPAYPQRKDHETR